MRPRNPSTLSDLCVRNPSPLVYGLRNETVNKKQLLPVILAFPTKMAPKRPAAPCAWVPTTWPKTSYGPTRRRQRQQCNKSFFPTLRAHTNS